MLLKGVRDAFLTLKFPVKYWCVLPPRCTAGGSPHIPTHAIN